MTSETDPGGYSERAREIAARVERFVRNVVIPFEKDPRRTAHGPQDADRRA